MTRRVFREVLPLVHMHLVFQTQECSLLVFFLLRALCQCDRTQEALSGCIKRSSTKLNPDREFSYWQGYTPEDEEDSAVATVTAVWVYQARYRIPLTKAPAGNWVLLEGVDATITKTATVRALQAC